MKLTLIALAAATALAPTFTTRTAAQDTKFEELRRATDNISALIDAENHKSALCKSYEGKVVTPTGFDAMVRTLPKITEKGEFETTAQYEARISAAKAQGAGGPHVLLVPVERAHLRYDADNAGMMVEAGAFRTGQFSTLR